MNLLVILPDELTRLALACYGGKINTPNIDRLAHEGVRCTAACSTMPVCVPFRFTLMTGEYAHSRFVPEIEWRMSPAETTLADEFNAAGFETLYVGKWHLHGGQALLPGHTEAYANRHPVPRRHQGRWRHWRGFELANNHWDTNYFVDDDPTPRRVPGYQCDGLTGILLEAIDSLPTNQPFACVFSPESPHFPMQAPAEDLARWHDADPDLPPNFLVLSDAERVRLAATAGPAGQRRVVATGDERERFITYRRTYFAMVENLDRNVGRILEHLQRIGRLEDTIIVFTSDHGDLLGSHGHIGKGKPWEESIGVPLIVRDPRLPLQRRGAIVDVPTCSEDLFPTLLGMLGLPPRRDLPGTDLTPLFAGAVSTLDRPGVMLELTHQLRHDCLFHRQYWRAFRSPTHLYSVLGGVEGGMPWQLYDLTADPWQLRNLVDEPLAAPISAQHHAWLRQRLIASEDHYVLAPAWGQEGLNLWMESQQAKLDT